VTPRACDLVVTKWGARFRGQTFPCSVGRSGIGAKRGEGDGITPVGNFRIGQVYYRPDRLSLTRLAVPCQRIGPHDIWSDDPTDPAYNLHLKVRHPRFGFERLRRADPLYDAVAVLNFNWPEPVPGRGSAIFLHIWRTPRHPTEGCIAFNRQVFQSILQNWTTGSRVRIG
jgi:L,D-peptidoglycan transpeptidase YkuD (ErfK/YbiS/YcfS/YnhG family)